MAVATAGIGLPEFDQGTRHTGATLVEHAAVHEDAWADRHFARLRIVQDKVVIERVEHAVAEDRPGDFALRTLKRDERALR